MPHLIPDDAIKRLSTLRGVTSFDDWKRQLEDADDRIRAQLHGSIDDAWRNCLPTWIEFGRINDCSRAARTPKYWPSYSNWLGRSYARTYREDFHFLLNILTSMPPNSYEYLCAYDLLELIASEFYALGLRIPEQLFAINLPVPHVVRVETDGDDRYNGLETIGAFLRRYCLIAFGDDNA